MKFEDFYLYEFYVHYFKHKLFFFFEVWCIFLESWTIIVNFVKSSVFKFCKDGLSHPFLEYLSVYKRGLNVNLFLSLTVQYFSNILVSLIVPVCIQNVSKPTQRLLFVKSIYITWILNVFLTFGILMK